MRRTVELDGLRALAAIGIVSFHFSNNTIPWGWAGVDIFFVLSGYLITGILLKHGESEGFLKAFYVRRGLRIWPIYYGLLLALAIHQRNFGKVVFCYLVYAQEIPRYWGGYMPLWSSVQHTWTLALEEQFYLLWPPLVLLVGFRFVGPLSVCIAMAAIAMRSFGVHPWLLASRCDGFALGGLLSTVMVRPNGRVLAVRMGMGAAAIGLTLMVALKLDGRHSTPGPILVATLLSLAIVSLIVAWAGRPYLAPLRFAPLAYLGAISYGLYLYHQPILFYKDLIASWFGLQDGPRLWAVLASILLLVAVLSWHLVEQPILRLKKLFEYRNQTPVQQNGASRLPVATNPTEPR